MPSLQTIGVQPPSDFPEAHYTAVHIAMQPRLETDADAFHHYASGWNSVAYRFIECAHHSDSFTASIQIYGAAPPPDRRVNQEIELFGFFVSGFSTLESFCFSASAIAHILRPGRFPIATPDHLKAISPSSTRDRFAAEWPAQAVTGALIALQANPGFAEWRDIRNALAHRGSGARGFNAGAIATAVWTTGLPVDDQLTVTRRAWLAAQLGLLVGAMNAFVIANL
jgi:hypothetical protein